MSLQATWARVHGGRVDDAPPRLHVVFVNRLDWFPEARHQQLRTGFWAQLQQGLGGLVPSVQCKAERSPMNRKKAGITKQSECLKRVLCRGG
jgi:hypothetical protein